MNIFNRPKAFNKAILPILSELSKLTVKSLSSDNNEIKMSVRESAINCRFHFDRIDYLVEDMNDTLRGMYSYCNWGCEPEWYEHRGMIPPEYDVPDDTVYYSAFEKKKKPSKIKQPHIVACDRYTRYELKKMGLCPNCRAAPGSHKAKHRSAPREKSRRFTY